VDALAIVETINPVNDIKPSLRPSFVLDLANALDFQCLEKVLAAAAAWVRLFRRPGKIPPTRMHASFVV
jgi:hypothetical protein